MKTSQTRKNAKETWLQPHGNRKKNKKCIEKQNHALRSPMNSNWVNR